MHLFLGPQADNMRDAKVKGRTGHKKQLGENNHKAKLTNAEVRDLRAVWREYGGWGKGGARQGSVAQGVGYSHLATLFGIKESPARAVVYRKTWRFV